MPDIPSDIKAFNRQLIEEFRASRNAPGGPMNGRQLLLLTTTGAKTGQRRTTPMMYIRDGDRLLVIASDSGAPAHPAWYYNLLAHPVVTVEIGADTYDATAVALAGADREETWARIIEKYPFFADHQAKVTRQIPVISLERREPQ
jgi:deazaflavin-dependent oxidoreductase (nitroreductase family)